MELCKACGRDPVDPIRPYVDPETKKNLEVVVCRACFLEEDARSESLEAEFGAWVWRDSLGWPSGSLETFERPLPPVLPGLERLELLFRRRANGRRERVWRCRCSCGVETFVSPRRLRAGAHCCKGCAARENVAGRRGPTAPFVLEGKRVAELARIAGVNRATIRYRLHHGWPAARLAAPATHYQPPRRAVA